MNHPGQAPQPAAWPSSVFDAPVLRDLDPPSRERICAAGKLYNANPGTVLYREQEAGDSFFVVVTGSVALSAIPRGHDSPTVVRVAQQGDTFGDEATLPGGVRRTTATAQEPLQVAEIPVAVYRRAVVRSGATGTADQEQRILRRRATHDLLRTMAFSAHLTPDDLGLVLDAVRYRTFRRGQRIYGVGDVADHFYLIASGIVQLQTEDEGRIHVRAYLSPGDFFGDEELLRGGKRQVGAVAMGECHILVMPDTVLRTLSDRNPDLLGGIRRIAGERQAVQQQVVGEAVAHSTRHVFKDLYRMQMATSLLTIDQDTCVRCGHCAWSCQELYGVARLVRRGDKVVTQLKVAGTGKEQKSLMVPNSCQHCKNPVCMLDCPTGAIGREPEGEVFIRSELCTGCGNCSKACPWENIRMAPRPQGSPIAESLRHTGHGQTTKTLHEMFPEVATKCDLCRVYEAPACVQACPTESIVRLDPTQDFAEVARLLGSETPGVQRRRYRIVAPVLVGLSLLVASALGAYGIGVHASGIWAPGAGLAYGAGWTGGGLMLLLLGYIVPKRFVRLWMRVRKQQSAARRLAEAESARRRGNRPGLRSRVRPFYVLHIALGIVAMGVVAAHAGARLPPGVAGALQIAFWLTALGGMFGAIVYAWVPRRLARLERTGALPEDLRNEGDALVDKLYRAASGRSDVVKSITERFLLPYAKSMFGPVWLLVSGRGLRAEEDRLHLMVDKVLQGRSTEKLAGLDDVIRTVVEMRALPLRRFFSWLLRAWMPGHVLLTGMVTVLLVIHVVSVLVLR